MGRRNTPSFPIPQIKLERRNKQFNKTKRTSHITHRKYSIICDILFKIFIQKHPPESRISQLYNSHLNKSKFPRNLKASHSDSQKHNGSYISAKLYASKPISYQNNHRFMLGNLFKS